MISFVRIDDRIIHGQVITRWAKEYPCDGIVVVNDRVATTSVLKNSFVASTDKKVFVWTFEEFKTKAQKVLESDRAYFLITKDPIDMAKLLVDENFVPSNVKRVVVGPANDRPGAVKLGNNQSITQAEADALERIHQKGYDIEFALIAESSIGKWPKFRSQFGY
ncbi:MAG: PTS sugar transporter subunit IIB [Erysipelothrix sp.]|nr:PTS sugar transporter subunit IIB [Erysipelothrix sp.]